MQKRGFTLIELLVTIVIIGLLTTVATTSFLTAQRNARDGARRTSLTAVGAALEAYKLVESKYPGVVDPSNTLSSGYVSNTKCVINHTYYYSPSAGCPVAFDPTPNWIPGLAKYLTPTPIEKRYLGFDGLETTLGSFSEGMGDAGTPSAATRTYSYKKTATGYSAYVRIEGSACNGTSTCVIGK
ncbi:hypothetical protein BH11PAT4_BH11PAT4_6110 [soil metagenome]